MRTTISKNEYMNIYSLVGLAQEVHATLGRGLEEGIYQEAFELELMEHGKDFERQKPLHTFYKGHQLKKMYVADLVCDDIVVELKAVSEIISEHRAQLMNYMRITKSIKGLLINFGEKSLRVERYLYQQDSDDFVLLSEKNLNYYVGKE